MKKILPLLIIKSNLFSFLVLHVLLKEVNSDATSSFEKFYVAPTQQTEYEADTCRGTLCFHTKAYCAEIDSKFYPLYISRRSGKICQYNNEKLTSDKAVCAHFNRLDNCLIYVSDIWTYNYDSNVNSFTSFSPMMISNSVDEKQIEELELYPEPARGALCWKVFTPSSIYEGDFIQVTMDYKSGKTMCITSPKTKKCEVYSVLENCELTLKDFGSKVHLLKACSPKNQENHSSWCFKVAKFLMALY